MPTNTMWDGGWYRGAQRRPSPNFGPRPAQAVVDLVVVHSISLPPRQYGGEAIFQLFDNSLDWDADPYFQSIRGLRVSAHFVVLRNGALWQCVDCDQRAWHAGQSSYRGRSNCNDDSIGVELEGFEGDTFEPAQYASLIRLVDALARHYPIAHVAGHEHIAPGRKADPGVGFDWAALQRGLAWPDQCFPQRGAQSIQKKSTKPLGNQA